MSPVTSWYSRCCCCCRAAAAAVAFGVFFGLPFSDNTRLKLPKLICFEIGLELEQEEEEEEETCQLWKSIE